MGLNGCFKKLPQGECLFFAWQSMEFLVMGRYPLSLVRTMPTKYSLFGEWCIPCPVEFNVSLLRGDESRLGIKTNSS